jgi:hypothetical protein
MCAKSRGMEECPASLSRPARGSSPEPVANCTLTITPIPRPSAHRTLTAARTYSSHTAFGKQPNGPTLRCRNDREAEAGLSGSRRNAAVGETLAFRIYCRCGVRADPMGATVSIRDFRFSPMRNSRGRSVESPIVRPRPGQLGLDRELCLCSDAQRPVNAYAFPMPDRLDGAPVTAVEPESATERPKKSFAARPRR